MYAPGVRRRDWLLASIGLTGLAAVSPAVRGQAAALQLGVLPNVSPRRLATIYQPLRDVLEARLQRPVQVLTAPDFASFHARAVDGQYGLYITAANLGALAIADGQGQGLGQFEPGMPALAVALRTRAAADPVAALRGRRLALANPASLVALRGALWLREQGLEEGRDYTVAAAPNEDSLARWLDSGDAPLALMSRGEFDQLGDARRQTLAVVQQFATVPGFIVLAPAHQPAADVAALQAALQAFFASPALAVFTAATGVRTLRALGRADLAALDVYLEPTRRRLAAAR